MQRSATRVASGGETHERNGRERCGMLDELSAFHWALCIGRHTERECRLRQTRVDREESCTVEKSRVQQVYINETYAATRETTPIDL